jgi:hypothetical protein
MQQALQNSGLDQKQIEELAKKIQQQQQACNQCQGLSQALQQAAQCMQSGAPGGRMQGEGMQQAAAALAQAASQLSEMEMAEQELQALQAALAELKDAREGMCQGTCPAPREPSDQIGNQGPQEGYGYGSRIGREKAAHNYSPSKEKVRLRSGEIIGQMLIDGPQIRGEAAAEVRSVVEAATRELESAVERQNVSRQYENVLRVYFERLAGLRAKVEGGEQAPGEGASPSADGEGGSRSP